MPEPKWREVSDGVFVRGYEHLDISTCVVQGGDGLLVVDSRSSPAEAAEMEADLAELGGGSVAWLVNTHAHFDHTFGNQHFGPGSTLDVAIYGHHLLPAHLDEYERPRLVAWRDGSGNEPARDWDQVVITPPTHLVTDRQPLQLGDRLVELVPLGRGHTDNDLVVHVPDAHTWIVGDVVEASGPPMFGSGCFPLDLPRTLDGLLDQIDPADIIIPGHGSPVGRDFVVDQAADLTAMARGLRALYASGATVEQCLAAQDGWPFPVEGLELAVTRAFTHLDKDARETTS